MTLKFSVGQEVKIPGTRIRSPRYQNQFAFDRTGIIEQIDFTKPRIATMTVRRANKTANATIIETDTKNLYCRVEIKYTCYKINGKWYLEDGIKPL